MPVSPLANAGGPFRWKSKVSVHDLFNAVKGTYISTASNWQPTDFPPYMQDNLHGYSSDANLAADNNERRFLDIQLPFTVSASTAQRLAKIELLRRRNQGTGTFQFNLYGLQMAVLDVIAMNLAYLGWTNKLLEVLAFRFTLNAKQDGDQRVIALGTQIDVQETSPSTYEWNTAEELTHSAGLPAGEHRESTECCVSGKRDAAQQRHDVHRGHRRRRAQPHSVNLDGAGRWLRHGDPDSVSGRRQSPKLHLDRRAQRASQRDRRVSQQRGRWDELLRADPQHQRSGGGFRMVTD
jgi:hypothetical protein